MATVLVVEDGRWNMELVTSLLEAAGHVVLPATTAEEGIERARVERPDLILMDVRPPAMPGAFAVRILKSDPRTERIPTIALTAEAMRRDDESALEAGFDGCVSRPIDTRRFPRDVERFLRLGRRT